MSASAEFVVTADGRVLAPGTPLLHADDPLFARGDGVFETLLVRRRRPTLLAAHLSRLAGSAALAGLPRPDLEAMRAAAEVAASRCGGDDAVLRLVHGRGRDGAAVAFVTVSPVPAHAAVARRDGVSVMTLQRSPVDGGLAAAKSSSYASNAAALRHGARLGFADVVFVAPGGAVLEGARSTVVIDTGAALVTPPTSLPILAGTTVRALFATAGARGVPCREDVIRIADLLAAQSVWLLSAITLAARVTAVDGVPLTAGPGAMAVAALIDSAILG